MLDKNHANTNNTANSTLRLWHALQKMGETDEIVELNDAFDAMIIRLGESITQLKAEILERRKAEKEIQDLNTSLEQRVEQRTLELRNAQKQLVANAHAAGMAEIATGALHNLGNVLNSVLTAAADVITQIESSKLHSTVKAIHLLNEKKEDLHDFLTKDAKGKKMLEFLDLAAEHLVEQQLRMQDNLRIILRNSELMQAVIATQQQYAKADQYMELVDIHVLLDDALSMQKNILYRNNIVVTKNYSKDLPEVSISKIKVINIFLNLIKNAQESIVESKIPDGTIIITTRVDTEKFTVEITDNGGGITADKMSSIFRHGFTSKSKGHGFGLHTSANAATEMGGKLTASSPGKNLGAAFILELPLSIATQKKLKNSAKEA